MLKKDRRTGLRLSLGLKIGLGFAVGATMTVAVGLVGIVGLTRIAGTIDKTAIANDAFVAMNDLNTNFANYLSTFERSDADATRRLVAKVGSELGKLDNGDPNFAEARKSLASIEGEIGLVDASHAKMMKALADIEAQRTAMSEAVSKIAAAADTTTASAVTEETDALKLISTLNTLQPLIDQVTFNVLKCAAAVQKFAATGDDSLPLHINLMVGSLDQPLAYIQKATLDPSAGKATAVIAAGLKDARKDAEALGDLYKKSTAPDATQDDKTAFADAAAALSFNFEGLSARTASIRQIFTNQRNNAVATLQQSGQKRNDAKNIALIGQKAGEALSRLVIQTKDYLASNGRGSAKAVYDLADAMNAIATETDKSGATKGLVDNLNQYRTSFDEVAAATTAQSRVQSDAEAAASSAVKRISAISQSILAETATTTGFQRIIGYAVLAIGCLLTLVFAIATGRSVRNPINALNRIMARLAEGDTEVSPPGVDRQDEIGEMSRTVEIFRDAAIEKRRLEAMAGTEAAERAERQARIDAMIRNFRGEVERMLAGVAEQTRRMQGTAHRLNEAADESQRQALSASGASTEASENVSTVAASAEELAASVNEISDRVRRTVEIVAAASDRANESNDQISSLAQSASRIGDVVKLIRSIADQTNLLALNATIEAARAGDAGKGFAVVAAEVKQLADQTAKATLDISGQIDGIQAATRTAVDSIVGIARSMHEVNDFTASIAAAVAQQGSATSEISRNAQGASQGTQMVAHSVDTLVRTSVDTTEAAGEVNAVAREVTMANETLTRTIDTFLETVAAA